MHEMNFFWGVIYILSIGAVDWVLYRSMFKQLMELEKGIKAGNRPEFKTVTNWWLAARFFVTVILFSLGWCWYFEFYWSVPVANTLGWTSPLFYLTCAFALVGWMVTCWLLARLWLKGFAPHLYDCYQPYYNNGHRTDVRDAINSLLLMGVTSYNEPKKQSTS